MPTAFRFYLLWAAANVLAGWILSAGHCLTAGGALVASGVLFLGLHFLTRPPVTPSRPSVRPKMLTVLRRRFRRPLPFVFLVVTTGVFLGGVLHAPNNYDGLTYRLPRLLHWLAADGWTWLVTNNDRMNYSGTGWEWMALPLFVFKSDRALFLINALGFLLLPGLVFSLFRQAGISRRTAAAWMWLLPLGFGYVLQAGSIGNDLTGAVFCLLAVHFGLRARRSGRGEDVWLAGLAAALLTGIKSSNLPLLLPCLLAMAPVLKHLRQRWMWSVVMTATALAVSIVPLAVLNYKNTGDWTGDPKNLGQMQIRHPGAALLGNGVMVAGQLLMPPVLPGAGKVPPWIDRHLPESWKHLLTEHFPRFSSYRLNELPQEESASLGLGLSFLLALSVLTACFRRGKEGRGFPGKTTALLLGGGAWVAALFFMAKIASEAAGRLLLPYYPLLVLPFLALPEQDGLARRSLWQKLTVLVALMILPGLILSPSRPLWPARTVSHWLEKRHPESNGVRRLTAVYQTYQNRNDLLAPLRAGLPAGVTSVGFVAGIDDSDCPLWRPWGQRRVIGLVAGGRQILPVPPDMEWVVVKEGTWTEFADGSFADWAARSRAETVLSVPIAAYASAPPATWSLVRIRRNSALP